jgi:glycosyltransferase involved in cell wall biosynthesis
MANCYGAVLRSHVPAAATIATMRTGKPLPALFRRSLRAVRHIVANSREARDALVQRHAIPIDKITVIYNSIVFPSAAERDPTRRESVRAQFGASANTTVLLCVAMFRPEKNQRELIDTVTGLPPKTDLQLWLAGDGPARPECEALVRSRHLQERVKFVGFHRDPTPLYNAADIAVHASWSDALSNFVIEAQSHGLPAVVFDGQGMRECVVPDRTGWVIERGDHDAFRARVLALMNDTAATKGTRAAEARAYARTTFDPARQVQAYLDLFARIAAQTGEHRRASDRP